MEKIVWSLETIILFLVSPLKIVYNKEKTESGRKIQ